MQRTFLMKELFLVVLMSLASSTLVIGSTNDWAKKPLKEALNTPEHQAAWRSITVSRGRRFRVIDMIRQFFTFGQKIELGNFGFSGGGLTPKKVRVVKAFLALNGLKNWHISINEYDPLLIWRRTWKNSTISWYTRYTYGILMTFLYTIQLPRLTGGGGDFCNPLARTICLYSNDLTIALHEAGHAKACSSRSYLLLELLLRDAFIFLPLIHPLFQLIAYATRLYQEAEASLLAQGFLMAYGSKKEIKKWYRKLIPPYITYLKQALAPLFQHKVERLLLAFFSYLGKNKLLQPILKLMITYHLPYALYLNLFFLLQHQLKKYFLHQRDYYKWIHIDPDRLYVDWESSTIAQLFKIDYKPQNSLENELINTFQAKYFAKPAFSLLNLLYQLLYNFVINPPITLLALLLGKWLSLCSQLPLGVHKRLSTVEQLRLRPVT